MTGGPSHVDTFDPKPALAKYAGEPLTGKGDINVRQGWPGPLMPSPFQFKKYGQSGLEFAEIFPNLGQHADEMAILRSIYARSNDHVQSTYELQSGQIRAGYPSMGAWITYGLGSNERSARVRCDTGSARRAHCRSQQLDCRLHARCVPGNSVPLVGRPDPRFKASRRINPGAAARAAR